MNLHIVNDQVARHLDQISKLFKPGVKLTILVRTPTNDEADFILSDDSLLEAIKALERRKDQRPLQPL